MANDVSSFAPPAPAPQPARVYEMRAALDAIFQKIWVEKQDHLFPVLYDKDAEFLGIDPTATLGLAEFQDLVTEFRRHQEMLNCTITDFISDGADRCAVMVDYDVFIEAAQAQATLRVFCMYSFRGAKVSRMHAFMDRVGILEQIGALPDGAYFIGLSGGKFS